MHLIFLCPTLAGGENGKTESLIRELDNMVDKKDTYVSIKENRIDSLKYLLYALNVNEIDLYGSIAGEYRKFQTDSSVKYFNKAIFSAKTLGDKTSEIYYTIALAEQYTITGLYMEAEYALSNIARKDITGNSLLEDYWMAYYNLYRETGRATPQTPVSRMWKIRSQQYRDSILMYGNSNSDRIFRVKEMKFREQKLFEQALEINSIRMDVAEYLTPEYALAAYDRYCIYADMGKEDDGIELLVRSAVSDINCAIRDQSSMYALASIFYKKGDLNHAWKYINYSYWATSTFNSRFRSWSYNKLQFETNNMVTESRIAKGNIISRFSMLLAIVFAVLFAYIISINKKLNSINNNLKEVDRIKDTCISRFFKLYSSQLNNMQKFRSKIHKNLKRGDIDEILNLTRPSEDITNEEIHELYKNFDKAFLDTFPDFVAKFNDLLLPEERIVLKEDEMLNTELRIFAMIRLGISDSAQIAEFLHYSIRTIYNYRSRIKRKTCIRDNKFEEYLMRI